MIRREYTTTLNTLINKLYSKIQQDVQEIFFEDISNLTENVKFLSIEREQQGAMQAQAMRPIPEEKRKEIIYECPEFLGMKYTLHLNNEAATLAVQKNDAALYGI
ncbi:hypothetical protein BB561_005432 [Smittium simulii]|uniref:Uncharacterized protein n=1 Tax=Smittium simulii TaxID=133385 RepID=A0A2T9YAG6_9FUNG|nr:hypothetical protein BB561_005432 [Smittium simulii]